MAPSELVVSYMSLVDVQLHQMKQDMACAEVSTVFWLGEGVWIIQVFVLKLWERVAQAQTQPRL